MKKLIAISILFVLCLLILANQFHKIFFVQIALLLMFLLFIDIIYQFIVKKNYTFLSIDLGPLYRLIITLLALIIAAAIFIGSIYLTIKQPRI